MGGQITPEQLPPSLEAMPNDPYRSPAWRLRKAGGFFRSEMPQKEFAEFARADWMRTRPELPVDVVRRPNEALVRKALALARGPAAKGIPGHVGDKPAGFVCGDDD